MRRLKSKTKKFGKHATLSLAQEKKRKKTRREFFGLLFLFVGVLFVVSLSAMFGFYGARVVSNPYSIYPYENILGLFGDVIVFFLVNGFGRICAWVLSLGIIVLGYCLIRGKEIKYLLRKVVYFSSFFIFFCILFSIPSLNILHSLSFADGGGFVGHFVVGNLFEPAFSNRLLGPYLIMAFLIFSWLVIGTSWSFDNFFERGEKWLKILYMSGRSFLAFLFEKIKSSGLLAGELIAKRVNFKMSSLLNKNQIRAITNCSEPIFIGEDEVQEMERIEKRLREFEAGVKNIVEVYAEDAPIFDDDDDANDEGFFLDSPGLESEEEENQQINQMLDKKDFSDGTEHDKFSNEPQVSQSNPYIFPSVALLEDVPQDKANSKEDDKMRDLGRTLLDKLKHFNITGEVTTIKQGPVITRYEIKLDPHIKVSKVTGFADDLAMALMAPSIRIVAPIPGKDTIGIEIPNITRKIIYFKGLVESNEFKRCKFELPFAVGKDVEGEPIIIGVEEMPHLLIAGQTGAGKSVGLNTLILSIIFTKSPEDCRLVLIDPKKVEFTIYKDIPHLLTPVVTESEDAIAALNWITAEMDERYRVLQKVGVRNIKGYNEKCLHGRVAISPDIPEKYQKKMAYIIVIVDELADLMLLAGKDVEAAIQRIAQLARAVGIHLVVATQRPSVNVITGVIKANLPSRIAFKTPTVIDSRTILDSSGAEKLLGKGDMLFYKTGALSGTVRVHGAFVADSEAESIANFAASQNKGKTEIYKIPDEFKATSQDKKGGQDFVDEDKDDLLEDAARIVISNGEASATLLQRRLKVGFARAARLVDQLELLGIVGQSKGAKPRELLVDEAYIGSQEWREVFG